MSTYTYDLTTNIGKVRLKIGDNDIVPITDAHFSDEEIQVFLDEAGGNILLASALALEAWAAALTDIAVSERIGDYQYSKQEANAKLELAKRYRETDASSPVLAWAEMDLTD